MSDEKKVLCPWCGKEMTLEEELPYSGIYAYVCECGAVSPNESGKENALKAALSRPLQNPLTLNEVTERKAVWLDIESEVFPVVMSYDSDEVFCQFYYDKGNYFSDKTKLYGKCWRCWATKPTDEERRAAGWKA